MADPIRRAALETLACLVNDRAGVTLAQVQVTDDDSTPFALIRRGTTPCDVSVTVTCEPRDDAPLRLKYRLTMFTEIGWAYYGDPFMTAEAYTGDGAIQLLARYVPLDHAH